MLSVGPPFCHKRDRLAAASGSGALRGADKPAVKADAADRLARLRVVLEHERVAATALAVREQNGADICTHRHQTDPAALITCMAPFGRVAILEAQPSARKVDIANLEPADLAQSRPGLGGERVDGNVERSVRVRLQQCDLRHRSRGDRGLRGVSAPPERFTGSSRIRSRGASACSRLAERSPSVSPLSRAWPAWPSSNPRPPSRLPWSGRPCAPTSVGGHLSLSSHPTAAGLRPCGQQHMVCAPCVLSRRSVGRWGCVWQLRWQSTLSC